MKTKQDNDMTDYTSAIYAKNKTELLCLIKPGVIYDENQIGQWWDQIGQWRDKSYRPGLN